MSIKDTYEFRHIQKIVDSIEYSNNANLNHAYHKGFLMAVLAQCARHDNKAIHILEQAKRGLDRHGFKPKFGPKN